MKKKRLGVIGVGSAGLISLCSTIQQLDNTWEIVSIYDPSIDILGIGESTNPNFLSVLQTGINFLIPDDLEKLDSTLKWGTKYHNWRTNSWVNPLFGSGVAIHFNNFKLKELVFDRLKSIYPTKFIVIEGKVTSLVSDKNTATVTVNDINEKFDWVIDCRGFPDNYDEYVISDCSPVNHCFVYDVLPFDNSQVTDHYATEHGWTFGIPLSSRYTYGYLFNNTINTIDEAIVGFENLIKEKINISKLKEYKFRSYYAKKVLDNRILKNGNRALFFEPLSASSIYVYVAILEVFVQHITHVVSQNPFDTGISVNKVFRRMFIELEDMLSFLYHGGSIYRTEFWNYAAEKGKHRLRNSEVFQKLVPEYLENYKKGRYSEGTSWYFMPHNLRIIDKKMGYNYFNTENNNETTN